MVMAISGAVIMGVNNNKVSYYCKCNQCQTSEYNSKTYKETDWLETGVISLGNYKCPSCGEQSEIKFKFSKLNN